MFGTKRKSIRYSVNMHGCANSTGLRLLNYTLYSERENSLIRLDKHVRENSLIRLDKHVKHNKRHT